MKPGRLGAEDMAEYFPSDAFQVASRRRSPSSQEAPSIQVPIGFCPECNLEQKEGRRKENRALVADLAGIGNSLASLDLLRSFAIEDRQGGPAMG